MHTWFRWNVFESAHVSKRQQEPCSKEKRRDASTGVYSLIMTMEPEENAHVIGGEVKMLL